MQPRVGRLSIRGVSLEELGGGGSWLSSDKLSFTVLMLCIHLMILSPSLGGKNRHRFGLLTIGTVARKKSHIIATDGL